MSVDLLALPLLILTVAFLGCLLALLSSRREFVRQHATLALQTQELERAKAQTTQLQQALQTESRWTQSLLNRARDMVFVHGVTPTGMPDRFQEVNQAASEMLQYPRERLLAMTIFDIEHAEPASEMRAYARLHDSDSTVRELAVLAADLPEESENMVEARRRIKRVLEDGQAVYEQVFVTQDGRHIPVEVQARRLDREGEPAILLSVTDLTERHESRRALSDSLRFSQHVLTHAAVGIVLYDGAHQVSHVNRIALRMLGVADAADYGRLDLFSGAYTPAESRNALQRGETVRFETTIDFDEVRRMAEFPSTRSGRGHFDILMHNLGTDKDYKARGYLVQIQDMTERRQIEADLKDRDRQLRQAQKLQAIGTLAGGIAHDFSNILTPILGYSEMAIGLCDRDETQREYLREVIRASLRAKDLASQILTFSRQSETEGRPIRIIPIVKEVLTLKSATLPASIRSSKIIRTERDIVVADPSQIHQVLMNLITNATHAMGRAGGLLEVTLSDVQVSDSRRGPHATLAAGPYLQISVRDEGAGIPPEVADRIFEPFFTTKPRGEGTGMGLAVVHGIVTSLKGQVTFESVAGRGTVFHVLLPTVDMHAEADTESTDEPPGGSECVLFVDDEPDIVRMQSCMLASLGYRPVVTHKAGEALRMFMESPGRFQLVIADQVMPDLSGMDLARQIHAAHPGTPILLCSGFTETLSAEQIRACGILDVLRKPITRRELAVAIRQALDHSG